jgi:prevent-host-death family protein
MDIHQKEGETLVSKSDAPVHTIPASEARVHFGEVLRRAYAGKEHIIVEKGGLPIAAIISMQDYEKYRNFLALERFRSLNRALNREVLDRGLNEEQLLEELKATRRAVFEERYGRVAV